MKRLLSLLLLLPIVLGGCDDDESRVETWTVASEKGVAGIAMGFGYTPAYIVKTGANADWRIASVPIGGFVFEKGYETEMRVRIDLIANPPADGPSHRYTLEKLLARRRRSRPSIRCGSARSSKSSSPPNGATTR